MEPNTQSEKTFADWKALLCEKQENVYDRISAEEVAACYAYSEQYMQFLNTVKMEREAVQFAVRAAEAKGFVPYTFGMSLQVGGRYYYNNRDKAVYLFTVGTAPLTEGVRIAAAHIDSPRIDLKQHPLYEDSGMGFFKTHYYGGIKKYQWTAIPLALHGTVVKRDGSVLEVCIGEDPKEPVFYINDLLPHLARAQMGKTLGDAIPGETLNLLIGSRPYPGEAGESDRIKVALLKLLYEKYGIVESDFISAELSAVPAFPVREIGFDRSLIGGYGHDDRVCAYPALTALLDTPAPRHTAIAVLADKEETGSDGATGMKSAAFFDLLDAIARSFGADPAAVRAASKCLSADVNAAYDPNFGEVYEKRNSSKINYGVVMTKFTGARGKSGTSDASAAYVGYVRSLFDRQQIVWQTGELGKVDEGGGGTVAMFLAEKNIDTVDLGVPVISMHAPYEVVAKADLYMTYRAISAFLQD